VSFDHESDWPLYRDLAEADDRDGMLNRLSAVADDAERISLRRFVIRKLAFDKWQNQNLDLVIALGEAAIEDCEALGGDWLQQANVLCFNMSANLADCWGDSFAREPRHFEKGIEYAEKALWYRRHLGKGPGSIAMPTWALAKHQQSLGHTDEAKTNYRRCLDLETEAAKESGKPAEISTDAPAGYLIAVGYVALLEDDLNKLSDLAAVLKEMFDSGGEPRDEADIILGQLRLTAQKMRSPHADLFRTPGSDGGGDQPPNRG
jgi:hypothetical protein